MTDNEIIKALECCKPQKGTRDCNNCPYAECEKGCADELIKESLDFINRQKAEIDRLKSENLALSQKRITMVERIDIVNNARNKAIREFADQLKRFICLEEDEGSDFREEMYFKIESLAKEMTEEQNV